MFKIIATSVAWAFVVMLSVTLIVVHSPPKASADLFERMK